MKCGCPSCRRGGKEGKKDATEEGEENADVCCPALRNTAKQSSKGCQSADEGPRKQNADVDAISMRESGPEEGHQAEKADIFTDEGAASRPPRGKKMIGNLHTGTREREAVALYENVNDKEAPL